MKNGKIKKAFGIFLFCLQILSIIAMLATGPGLYEPRDFDPQVQIDPWEQEPYTPTITLSFRDIVVSYTVGIEKMGMSIDCLRDALSHGYFQNPSLYTQDYDSEPYYYKGYYHTYRFSGSYVTEHEPEFMARRHAFEMQNSASQQLMGLVCLLSYLLPGILGLILMTNGNTFANFPAPHKAMPDAPVRKRDCWLKPVGIVLPLLCILIIVSSLDIYYLMQMGIRILRLERATWKILMELCSYFSLWMFFCFYFKKDRSVLIPASMAFYAVSSLLMVGRYLLFMFLDNEHLTALIIFLYFLQACATFVIFLLTMIAGVKLYRNAPRHRVRGIIAIAFGFVAVRTLLPVLFGLTVTLYSFTPVLLYGLFVLYVYTTAPRVEVARKS